MTKQGQCRAVVVDVKHRYPMQLDEYEAVLDWVRGHEGRARSVNPLRVFGGGDNAGGNLTAVLCFRMKDQDKLPMAGQVLFYPQVRLPFDTPAAT